MHNLKTNEQLAQHRFFELPLSVNKYNEEKQDYENVELVFELGSELSIQDHDLIAIKEINGYEIVEDDSFFRIVITFLTGHSKPSLDMQFTFKSLSI